MIKDMKELKDKTLKGLEKCYRYSKGDNRACYGCPYNELNEDCFVKLIANAYYFIYNENEKEEGAKNDRENQQ